MVGPEDSLSVQLHPDKKYADKHGLLSGKNEAWYFIDADEDADLIYGHNAKDMNELKEYMDKDEWEKLIRRIKVKQGDFVYVPATLLHAMQKGVIAYEVQEATDVTFRMYDFDRIGPDGKKRKLDIEESLECISFDPNLMVNKVNPIVNEYENYVETCFINNQSFKIVKIDVKGTFEYKTDNYLLMTVTKGEAVIDGIELKMGESVFVPKTVSSVNISGNCEILYTTEGD